MSTGRESVEYGRIQFVAGASSEQGAEEMRQRGQRLQYQAQQQGEQIRGNVASGLHTAAQRLREQAMQSGRPSLATRVADPMDRTAQYLSTHSLPQMGDDVQRTAREHPFWAAAGVFAAAFLVGRAFRRR